MTTVQYREVIVVFTMNSLESLTTPYMVVAAILRMLVVLATMMGESLESILKNVRSVEKVASEAGVAGGSLISEFETESGTVIGQLCI